jgi:GntR family transcriptional regulator, transcriptional repressor for pyruvate dehydrogenase complex
MPLRNDVTERIQLLLSQRQLVPGDRLPPERQLAAELGVSRASLREGLGRLLDLGILEARRGSGTYLAEVDLLDLLEVRLRLEPYLKKVSRSLDR